MITPVDGSNQLPVNRIPLRHAIDYLRQHYAVEQGVDNMGYFVLGGCLQSASAEERASCAQIHQQALERARAEISGCLDGAKIPIWLETLEGDLVPCGGAWARKQLEQKTLQSDSLYFATSDWCLLLPSLTSETSRNYFEKLKHNDDHFSSTLSAKSKGGRPSDHDWKFMKQLAECAIASRPNISRSALAESLVTDYDSKKPGRAPVKRTIERKLKSWNLPADDTIKLVQS